MPQRVSFTTEDGVTIVGALYAGKEGGPSALLLHMMPATKESWQPFAEKLIGLGWSSVLAIDLRGHGESTQQGSAVLDFKKFSNVEQQAKIHDVEAAVRWLAEHRHTALAKLALVGASIGANLSIAYAAAHPEIPAAAALSPGLEYRGVETAKAVASLHPSQTLFLAASAEDTYSLGSARKLAAEKKDAKLKELERAGHGTAMFEHQPEFMDEVAAWLSERMK